MRQFVCFLAALTLFTSASAHAQETPHFRFVSEYVRELGELEHIRDEAKEDLKEKDQQYQACIRNNTRFQLEIQSEIAILNGMRLSEPYDKLIPTIITFDQQKLANYQRVTDICIAFIAGPKDGVDYGALGAELPKMTAKLEYIDQALFEASPLVFATLIDMRADAENHASHLIITNAERRKLIEDIDRKFRDKLNQEHQNYTVSSASVLKSYLQKNFKGSDEQW